MKNDNEYIKELFDSDGIKAPEKLSEESMLLMLEREDSSRDSQNTGEPSVRRRAGRRPSFKRITAIAAAALVAVLGIGGLTGIIGGPPDTSAVNGELYSFNSESEIRRLLKDIDGTSPFELSLRGKGELIEEEAVTADRPDAGAETELVSNTAQSKATGATHSETYLQVSDVDEADIVKTDGRYIYYVTDKSEVVILSAKNGKTKKLATVGSDDIENYIEDIYIKGDKLITVGTIYKDDSDEGSSGIVVYDISDRSRPRRLYDFSQTGYILTSRMVGDYLYLVTNDYIYKGGRIVPECGSSGSMAKLDVSDICCVPEPNRTSYIVLSAVDISSGSQGRAATKAVFGASEEVYCNDHSLYAAAMEWDEKSSTTYTRIVRADLDGTRVKFSHTTRVRGYVATQFAMDEQDGYFRIATTSERAGMDVNNLYILDSDLKETGKVTGFARNESIKAVRFIGSKAYVITYEAIDPLFIIDVSDPADPRIEGEVKIDGFSTLLIPISNGRLLGIGHATGDNGYGGEYDSGLKLALFDISDPSEPKVLDSREFENMSSMAQYDHHALMVNSDAGYFAVPYEIWNDQIIEDEFFEDEAVTESEPEDTYETGVLLFKAGDKISSGDRHRLEGQPIYRSVFIGDWIYALDSEGNVQSFKPSL